MKRKYMLLSDGIRWRVQIFSHGKFLFWWKWKWRWMYRSTEFGPEIATFYSRDAAGKALAEYRKEDKAKLQGYNDVAEVI